MILRSLILVLVCVWYCEGDSFDKTSNISETNSDPCMNSDFVLKWESATRVKLENDIFEVSNVNKTRRGGRARKKHPVIVKLSNKRRRRKLLRIKAEDEYKIDIMNKLRTNVEVLLIVDFVNKSECGVGSLIKGELNNTNKMINDESDCLSVEASVEPRRRVMYPFLTPKCGCFIFRYHVGYRDQNTTTIRTPNPRSSRPHKKLAIKYCVEGEDMEGGGAFGRGKKHQRRRGKKGFLKKNKRRHRKEKRTPQNMRRILSRPKKEIFRVWEPQDLHPTSNSTYLFIDDEDYIKDLSENDYKYETDENQIHIDGIYENIPDEIKREEHDEYESEDLNQDSEEEDNNFVEDFGYEDVERKFSDYENENSEENDSEEDEENEINYNEDNKADDESKENDEVELHQFDEIYDTEHENQEKDKNCDSDESDESFEEDEESNEVISSQDSEEDIEREDKKVEHDNSINSIDTVYDKSDIRRRPNNRRRSFSRFYNNRIRHNHRNPRPRDHFRNRGRQNFLSRRNRTFTPWRESNRTNWRIKHRNNVNIVKASGVCCNTGVSQKKMILHYKLENNSEFNQTCDDIPPVTLSWVNEAFNVTEEFCLQKFKSCCKAWSLLSSNPRAPYFPRRSSYPTNLRQFRNGLGVGVGGSRGRGEGRGERRRG